MAISVRSTLSEDERIFTIAVDQCGANGIEGFLYHGKALVGWHFTGFLELTELVERSFQQMQYPREVLKRRFFSKRQIRPGVVCTKQTARRDGEAATYLLRVKQRQNASWQGTLADKKSGRKYGFRSFLELMRILDLCAGNPSVRQQDGEWKIERHYLSIALTESQSRAHVNEMLPGIAVCQLYRDGRENTFLLKLMFHEHHTCQGILYWKEKRCQQSFRSFLELLQLIGEAACTEEESWEVSAG